MEIRIQSGAMYVGRSKDGGTLAVTFHADSGRAPCEISSHVFKRNAASRRRADVLPEFQTLTLTLGGAEVALFLTDAQVSELIAALENARASDADKAAEADAVLQHFGGAPALPPK